MGWPLRWQRRNQARSLLASSTMKSVEGRFWSKVEIRGVDDCWNWTAAIDTPGYGAFKFNGKKANSHVVAYILTFGDIPKGRIVCHTCAGNRLCCNPFHLYAGTYSDNANDAMQSGTLFIPKHRGPTIRILSDDQITEIKKRLLLGETCISISNDFPVSKWAIYKIKELKNWNTV